MSKVWLTIGLVISAAAHAWLLLGEPREDVDQAIAALPIPVIELAPPPPPEAQPEEAEAPEPEPETVEDLTEPEPEVLPEPIEELASAPEAVNEPEPTPEPTPEPVAESRPEPVPPASPPPVSPRSDTSLADALSDTADEVADDSPLADAAGDFAGVRDGEARPRLRIDWGTPRDAAAAIQAADMRLVVVEDRGGEPVVVGEVRGYPRRPIVSEASPPTGFGNELRRVDDVPAFAATLALVRPGQGLAVLVPERIERRLRAKVMEVLFRQGEAGSNITTVLVRWRHVAGRVEPEVFRLMRRSS